VPKSSTAVVIVCWPFSKSRVSNAFAVPSLLPPAKSHGPALSIWRAGPVMATSSSQKLTLVMPGAFGWNT
jgi:hypothetical protein